MVGGVYYPDLGVPFPPVGRKSSLVFLRRRGRYEKKKKKKYSYHTCLPSLPPHLPQPSLRASGCSPLKEQPRPLHNNSFGSVRGVAYPPAASLPSLRGPWGEEHSSKCLSLGTKQNLHKELKPSVFGWGVCGDHSFRIR